MAAIEPSPTAPIRRTPNAASPAGGFALPVEPGFTHPIGHDEGVAMVQSSAKSVLKAFALAPQDALVATQALADGRIVAARNGPSAVAPYDAILGAIVTSAARAYLATTPGAGYDPTIAQTPAGTFPDTMVEAAHEQGLADYAAYHVSQSTSPFNPDAAEPNGNCTPASAVMAERMFGLAHGGGVSPLSAQTAIDAVRDLAGASSDERAGVPTSDAARVLAQDGLPSTLTTDGVRVIAAIKEGASALVGGDASVAGTWYSRFHVQVPGPFPHTVFVPKYEPSTGAFVLNDPNSKWGAIRITEDELRAFMRTGQEMSAILGSVTDAAATPVHHRWWQH